MKKWLLVILAVVVVAAVAIGILVGDRNRVNDLHAEAQKEIGALNQKMADKEKEIATAIDNLADVTTAKEAAEQEAGTHKSLAEELEAAKKILEDDLKKANDELATLKADAEQKEKDLAAALEEAGKVDGLNKLVEEGKKALEDAKAAASADVEKAKEEGQKALDAINEEITQAGAIWEKLEKGAVDGIEKEINAFKEKFPNSLLKFIVPKAGE